MKQCTNNTLGSLSSIQIIPGYPCTYNALYWWNFPIWTQINAGEHSPVCNATASCFQQGQGLGESSAAVTPAFCGDISWVHLGNFLKPGSFHSGFQMRLEDNEDHCIQLMSKHLYIKNLWYLLYLLFDKPPVYIWSQQEKRFLHNKPTAVKFFYHCWRLQTEWFCHQHSNKSVTKKLPSSKQWISKLQCLWLWFLNSRSLFLAGREINSACK